LAGALVLVALGCGEPVPPPGPRLDAPSTLVALAVAPPVPSTVASAAVDEAAREPGRGARIASIAMRTWVYLEPDDRSTKVGYLRAGAVVERGEAPTPGIGCAGGWYRVAPRGYVCVGRGASLELDHPLVLAAGRGPRRGEPAPYPYVLSRAPPPHLYLRLPSAPEQIRTEGEASRARSLARVEAVAAALGPADPLPAFLEAGAPLPVPYGADKALAYPSGHRGRARAASAFGLVASFDWLGRRFGLTTELDLVPLDRTRVAPPSALRGIEIARGGAPAFVVQHRVVALERTAGGGVRELREVPFRSGWELTGRDEGALVETTAGIWLPRAALRVGVLGEDPAGHARQGKKWIDVSIRRQILVAYEGRRALFATLVSTGRDELADPETTTATVRGSFVVAAKHVSGTMDGDETAETAFDLRDVPYIQYFHRDYALHGAYWHHAFGRPRSHGCINLAPADAAWLFEWTEPRVPPGWHGALSPSGGTLVYVHG
jgi:hypothetical protein